MSHVNNLIFDIGMHKAQDTEYYLSRGFNVVAVEADPTLCDEAATRLGRFVETGRLTILNLGIAEVAGERDFWICEPNSAWNSFNERFSTRDGLRHHAIKVPCVTFDTVLREHGVPYYLKIDIEGNDRHCLEALKSFDERPNYVSAEVDDNADELVALLVKLGYTRFKCISQFHFLPVERGPNPRLRLFDLVQRTIVTSPSGSDRRESRGGEGAKTSLKQRLATWPRTRKGWVFPFGSSGPFGEETAGRWQTSAEMLHAYAYFRDRKASGQASPFWNEMAHSFWVDIHAKRG